MTESDAPDFDAEFGSFLFWRLPIRPINSESAKLDTVSPDSSSTKVPALLVDCCVGGFEDDDGFSDVGSDWPADDEAEGTDLEADQSFTESGGPDLESDKPTLSLHRQLTVDSYKLRLERTVSSTCR